ncbi:MAG TPA: hypothetical protein VIF09_00365 [Polyangiaceae bacterium]
MTFASVTRSSLELLNQNCRAPGVVPGPVPPGRGAAAQPQSPDFAVVDEFIRVVPFVRASADGRPQARAYQVRSVAALAEPPATARGVAGSTWTSGVTVPFGQELEMSGSRFKKISLVVRADEAMVDGGAAEDMLTTQARLATTAIIRGLSEALLFSAPPDDQGEVRGLLPFLVGPQDVAYSAARKLMGGLAEIEARCAPSGGDFGARPDAFVLSSRARWRLMKEMEDKGVSPDFRHCPAIGGTALHYHGVPVLVGRVPEPAGGTSPVTDAWAVKLYGPSGIRIYHLGGESSSYGVRAENITTMSSFDGSGDARTATRGIEVFGVYALVVPEAASIARLHGVPTEDPFTAP